MDPDYVSPVLWVCKDWSYSGTIMWVQIPQLPLPLSGPLLPGKGLVGKLRDRLPPLFSLVGKTELSLFKHYRLLLASNWGVVLQSDHASLQRHIYHRTLFITMTNHEIYDWSLSKFNLMSQFKSNAFAAGTWMLQIGMEEHDVLHILQYFLFNQTTSEAAYFQTQMIVEQALIGAE